MSRLAVITATLVTTSSIATGNAQAVDDVHVDNLAYSLKVQTVRISRELRYHFRCAPQFRHLYQDVCDMYTIADRIHRNTRYALIRPHATSTWCLASDVAELDRLFHHVQELVDEMKQTQIHLSGHQEVYLPGVRIGFPQQRPTLSRYRMTRLCRMMDDMGETLHLLLHDIDGLPGPIPEPVIPAPIPEQVTPGPVIPQPPTPSSFPIGRFRGGRWSITAIFR